jgi:hypothetical protein
MSNTLYLQSNRKTASNRSGVRTPNIKTRFSAAAGSSSTDYAGVTTRTLNGETVDWPTGGLQFGDNSKPCLIYNGTPYYRFNSITREFGVWCNAGGTSQNVTMSVVATLQIYNTTTKTYTTIGDPSEPVYITSYGSGPTSSNYGTTTINIPSTDQDQELNQALFSAWAAGTLYIQWTATITRYTSGSHGSPVFYKEYFSDTIGIELTDEPWTDYQPTIESFTAVRGESAIIDSKSITSTSIYDGNDITDFIPKEDNNGSVIKLTMKYKYCGTTSLTTDDSIKGVFTLKYGTENNFDNLSGTEKWEDTATDLNTEYTKVLYLVNTSVSLEYNFAISLQIANETSSILRTFVSKYGIPLNINQYNNGIGIGGFSTATKDDIGKIDLHWNTQIYEKVILGSDTYGTVLPTENVTEGQIFFLISDT